jgi:hypothetical protein
MIMFYDILLLDDIVCATEPHDKRSHRLRSVVQCIPSRAKIAPEQAVPRLGVRHLKACLIASLAATSDLVEA